MTFSFASMLETVEEKVLLWRQKHVKMLGVRESNLLWKLDLNLKGVRLTLEKVLG